MSGRGGSGGIGMSISPLRDKLAPSPIVPLYTQIEAVSACVVKRLVAICDYDSPRSRENLSANSVGDVP